MRAQACVCLGILSTVHARAARCRIDWSILMAVVFTKHTPNLVVADLARSLDSFDALHRGG